MLDFARGGGTRQAPLDFAETVAESVELARGYAERAVVNLDCRVGTRPIIVFGDATRLGQVVVNLVRNVVEASKRDGRVIVSLPHLRNLVRLIVSDEGEGMTEEVRQHAFDPFYTTKRSPDVSRHSHH